MSVTTIGLFGDSLTVGMVYSPSVYQGGQGAWWERLAEMLANTGTLGPRLSSGFRGVGIGVLGSDSEVVYAGTWTTTASTDAFDKLPHGKAKFANGSGNTVTFTNGPRAVPGFNLYWVDYASGGNWSYSTDGGTNWTAMGQTLTLDNTLSVFYVGTAIAAGGTVIVRAANAAGTGVGCLPGGIEWVYDNTATTGVIVHNFSVGGQFLSNLIPGGSGDRMAIIDSVRAGSGSPRLPTPNAGTLCFFINDQSENNTTTWNTHLGQFFTRASPLGTVGFMSPWETESGTANAAAYRAQTKVAVAGGGVAAGAQLLDIFDAWSALGFGVQGTMSAALDSYDWVVSTARGGDGGTHEKPVAHADLGSRIYWWIRNQFLGLGAQPITYPVSAKAAAVAYGGARAAVAYAAGVPVSVR